MNASIQTNEPRYRLRLRKPQNPTMGFSIALSTREVVERLARRFDDVARNKGCPFSRPLLGALHAAFPLDHGPALVALLSHQRENSLEVDLAIAQRTEPAGPIRP